LNDQASLVGIMTIDCGGDQWWRITSTPILGPVNIRQLTPTSTLTWLENSVTLAADVCWDQTIKTGSSAHRLHMVHLLLH